MTKVYLLYVIGNPMVTVFSTERKAKNWAKKHPPAEDRKPWTIKEFAVV